MEIALRDMGLDPGMVSTIFDFFEDSGGGTGDEKAPHHPTRAFIRDAKAMKNTPEDVIELPNAYHFVIDMPGLRSDQIKVQIEDDSVLVVSGERRGRPEKEEAGSKDVIKYLRMERRLGKLLKKFALPENADKEKVSGNLENGVLTVVVQKSPPPETKKPKVIEVKVCGGGGAVSGGGEEVKAGDRHESDGTACK